jgi:hypothetical protein
MNRKDVPLKLFLVAAFISFLFSVTLWFFVDKDAGMFVGIWVPSILALAAAVRGS